MAKISLINFYTLSLYVSEGHSTHHMDHSWPSPHRCEGHSSWTIHGHHPIIVKVTPPPPPWTRHGHTRGVNQFVTVTGGRVLNMCYTTPRYTNITLRALCVCVCVRICVGVCVDVSHSL